MTEQVHSSFPTLLDTSILYSEVSPLSAARIFSVAVFSFTVILYFRPLIISLSSLNHFTLSAGVPEMTHSSVAESPAVTLMDAAFSKILAGSKVQHDFQTLKTSTADH